MNNHGLIEQLEQVVATLSRRLRQSELAVSPAQKTVLSGLTRHGPMTVSQLARRLGVAPPTITKMIDALEERSLVRRARDKRDRRVVYAVATREGSSVIEGAHSHGPVHHRLERLSDDQKRQAAEALRVLDSLFCRQD